MVVTRLPPSCWGATLMPLVSAVSRAPVCTKPSAPHFVWVCQSPRVPLICRCLGCVGASTPTSLEPVVPLPTCPPVCGAHLWDASPGQGQPPWVFNCTPLLQAAQPSASKRQFISKYHPLNLNTLASSGGSQWGASRAPAFPRTMGQTSHRRAAAAALSGRHGIRHYYQSTRGSGDSQHQLQIVDLRSDTLSTPCAEMRSAMARAEVGTDAFVEDPTVNEFQQRVAKIFGTEDALFVTSGTMGNLVSVMCHCRNRGEELLVGDKAHLYLYEQGGVAQIAGVSPRLVTNLSNGQMDLEELESKIQKEYPNPHYARTRLICLENTHNRAGGRILPLAHLREVRLLADRYGLAVHLDGARLMNAAVALGVEPAEIVQYCDSVSLCLTKGLGGPVGAVIGGRKEFIKECLRARKVLGGGMRQAGILAAAGLLALSQAEATLRKDHHRAKKFATGVQQLASPVCSVDLQSVETNMVMLTVDEPRISPQEFCDRMWDVSEAEILALGRGVKVRMFVMYKRTLRLVWYRNISEEDTEMALNKLKFVVQTYSTELGIV